MAKTKTRNKEGKSKKQAKNMANGHMERDETPEELYATALTLVEQSQPDEALKKAQKLWRKVQGRGIAEALPALNLLGEINVELGETKAAKA